MSAVEKGKQILPQAFKSITDLKSGGKFLKNIGVEKSFVGQQFNNLSEHLPKIGLDKQSASPLVNGLANAMGESPQTQTPKTSTRININKYPKI